MVPRPSAAHVVRPDAVPSAPPRDDAPSAALDVWCVDLEAGAALLIDAAARLGLMGVAPDPAGAADRGIHHTRTAARSALRLILAGYVGLELARRPFVIAQGGKPALDASEGRANIEFSLAHCDTAAIIAISRGGPIGVDVESQRSVRISDHRRALLLQVAITLSPAQPLPASPGEAGFLQGWVRLEALAKATGEGLGALLGRLEDTASPPSATQVNGVPLRVRDIDLGGRGLWGAVAATSFEDADDRAPRPLWLPLDGGWIGDWATRGEPAASSTRA